MDCQTDSEVQEGPRLLPVDGIRMHDESRGERPVGRVVARNCVGIAGRELTATSGLREDTRSMPLSHLIIRSDGPELSLVRNR
jgi:hypothetical protein